MAARTQELTAAQPQLDACTRCGLCLEACPTYALAGREADSPRGRLALVAGAISGPEPRTNGALTEHIDACIGCGECVIACPEDVRYDIVLDLARGLVRDDRAGTPLRRGREALLRTTLSSPRRLRTLAPTVAAARRAQATRMPEPIRTLAMLPLAAPSTRQLTAGIGHFTPARGQRRGHVALLLGCTERVFASDLQRTAVAVLAAEGYDVSAPSEPDCCGGWARELGDLTEWHASAATAARELSRIGDVDAVVTLAGRCTSSLRDGTTTDAPVRDLIAFLADAGPQAARNPLTWQVARHDSCQQCERAHDVADPVERLLAQIPRLQIIDSVRSCCGGRGLHPVRRPQAAAELTGLATSELVACGAQAIVSDEPSCAEQLSRALRAGSRELPVLHPLELLWLSLQPPA
jgi:glycolate oxidase iron-sulfur subunit